MPTMPLEDHVRMMLGRLVLENLSLMKQAEDLRAEMEMADIELRSLEDREAKRQSVKDRIAVLKKNIAKT